MIDADFANEVIDVINKVGYHLDRWRVDRIAHLRDPSLHWLDTATNVSSSALSAGAIIYN